MRSSNLQAVREVALALGDLLDKVVFVGATVVELYATDPAAPEVRPTMDVDCLVEAESRSQYRQIEKQLQQRGFRHDTRANAPICRWLCAEVPVDVMPTDPSVFGFANRWHAKGIKHTICRDIGENLHVLLLSPPFFVASKLEALSARQRGDLRVSPDLEDIIFIVDNRKEILEEIQSAPQGVRDYLCEGFAELLRKPIARESVAAVLPYGSEPERIEQVLRRMRSIAEPDG